MNKEHIKQLAKEFCDNEGMKVDIRCWYGGKVQILPDVLACFLQSIIEKGEVRHTVSVRKSIFNRTEDRQNVCGKCSSEELTVSSAGKEVKTPQEIVRKHIKGNKLYEYEKVVKIETVAAIMEEYAKQFKSSPASAAAPAKVVSDEQIYNFANFGKNLTNEREVGRIEGAEWMREQLTGKP